MRPTTRDAYKLMHDGAIAHAQLTYGNGMIMLGSAGKHGGGYDELVKTPAQVKNVIG